MLIHALAIVSLSQSSAYLCDKCNSRKNTRNFIEMYFESLWHKLLHQFFKSELIEQLAQLHHLVIIEVTVRRFLQHGIETSFTYRETL